MSKRVADMTPAEREKERARIRAWREANPEKVRAARVAYRGVSIAKTRAWHAAHPHKKRENLLRRYGLTPEQYDRMCAEQSGACAVCGSPFAGQKKSPAVDHCHKTGKVRALLCAKCNTAIGLAQDCPNILRGLADYLEYYGAGE